MTLQAASSERTAKDHGAWCVLVEAEHRPVAEIDTKCAEDVAAFAADNITDQRRRRRDRNKTHLFENFADRFKAAALQGSSGARRRFVGTEAGQPRLVAELRKVECDHARAVHDTPGERPISKLIERLLSSFDATGHHVRVFGDHRDTPESGDWPHQNCCRMPLT